jgi:hypothetical protein
MLSALTSIIAIQYQIKTKHFIIARMIVLAKRFSYIHKSIDDSEGIIYSDIKAIKLLDPAPIIWLAI